MLELSLCTYVNYYYEILFPGIRSSLGSSTPRSSSAPGITYSPEPQAPRSFLVPGVMRS
jgi:hypothetical protein